LALHAKSCKLFLLAQGEREDDDAKGCRRGDTVSTGSKSEGTLRAERF
jgi:hypothetical protein